MRLGLGRRLCCCDDFHIFDRVTYSALDGMAVGHTLLPSAASYNIAHSVEKSSSHYFGLYGSVLNSGFGLVKAAPGNLSEVWAVDFDSVFSLPGTATLLARSLAVTDAGTSCVGCTQDDENARWIVRDDDGAVVASGTLAVPAGSTAAGAPAGPLFVSDGSAFHGLDTVRITNIFGENWALARVTIDDTGAVSDRDWVQLGAGVVERRWIIEAKYNPGSGEIVYRTHGEKGRVSVGFEKLTPGDWVQTSSTYNAPATNRRTDWITAGPDGTVYLVESEGNYTVSTPRDIWVPSGQSRLMAVSSSGATVVWSVDLGASGSVRTGPLAVTPDGSKIYMAANPESSESQGYSVFNAADGSRLATFELPTESNSAHTPTCVVASDSEAVFGHEYGT